MTNKQYIGLIILIVAITSGAFYWYSYRPSVIKQDCYKTAVTSAIEKGGNGTKYSKDDFEAYYSFCLKAKGL